MCAVTDLCSADYDVILPVDVVRSLQVAAGTASVSGCVTSDVCEVTTKSDPPNVKGNPLEKVDSLPAGPEKSGGNLTNLVWSNVCIFAQTTLVVCLLLILIAISIAVCSGVQYSTKGVTSGTHRARRCANAAVYGINLVQCFTRLPVCVSCKLYRRTVLVESERRDELRKLRLFTHLINDKNVASCSMRSPTSLTTDPGGATREPIAYKLPTISCDGKSDPAVHQTRAVSRGLIRLSNSLIASPIVGVTRKDGDVRIACDCRYMNTCTVGTFDTKSAIT